MSINTISASPSDESSKPAFKSWMCLICGWIYDEAAGLPDEGIVIAGRAPLHLSTGRKSHRPPARGRQESDMPSDLATRVRQLAAELPTATITYCNIS